VPRPPTQSASDVRGLLRRAGFTHKRTTGSHEQWEGYVDGLRRVVTLDVNDEPFTAKSLSLKSMIRQSGLGKKRWYALHAGQAVELGNTEQEPG
jgi:predicted RNA binding protein YcfA (HicA-like mRNA interferase family)